MVTPDLNKVQHSNVHSPYIHSPSNKIARVRANNTNRSVNKTQTKKNTFRDEFIPTRNERYPYASNRKMGWPDCPVTLFANDKSVTRVPGRTSSACDARVAAGAFSQTLEIARPSEALTAYEWSETRHRDIRYQRDLSS